jgi:DnaJ domain
VLAAILYLLGWQPKGDTGKLAQWIRKNGVVLFAAGAALILTRNPGLAILAGALAYSLTQKSSWFPGGGGARGMSIEEAYLVLGLNPGATREEIKAAHRNLIRRSHPDQGGTAYLAAKVNAAKDILLKNVKG